MRFGGALILLAAAAASARADAEYSIINLGTLGGPQSYAYAINNSGQVVGESDTADGYRRAFLYTNGSMTDLGTLGGKYSSAYGINDAGQVVGQAEAQNGGQHAFLFHNGSMTVLGPTNAYTLAYAINNSGQVAGVMATDADLHAALFDHGATIDLDQNSGRSWGYAQAINNSGQIGGIGGVGESFIRAAIFNQGSITYPTTVVPYTTYINAINDRGIAAGQAAGHAVLFDGEGGVTDLDTLAGIPNYPYLSEAYGINNVGEVVGVSDTLRAGQHAFLSKDGVMRDLNALIDPKSGWILTIATAINDAGQIVGYGQFAGKPGAFLLTPTAGANLSAAVPEPATAGIALLGSAGLLLRRRRRTA